MVLLVAQKYEGCERGWFLQKVVLWPVLASMMPRIYKKCSASSEIADETLSTKAVQSPQIIRILTFFLFQAVQRANRT